MAPTNNLEPISPSEAVEWYLEHKSQEVTPSTVETYETSLDYFVRYCENEGFSNLNTLTGRRLERYRTWRREESWQEPLQRKTMRDQMYLLQDLIRYLESIEAVPSGLHEKVTIPKLRPNDGVRNVQLDGEHARKILAYLKKYHYAKLHHVTWLLLCETGRRTGGLYALDRSDYHPDAPNPHLAFRHRPEHGTRLKNENRSERNVNISSAVCEVIDDYLAETHPGTTDEHGREPLLATTYGRVSRSTIRKHVYEWSRPCEITGDCPHEREISSCEAAQDGHEASKCPSSVSPHALRHGYISGMLDAETPKPVLAERCDVSEAVIDKHYDERSEAEKQDLRRRILDEIKNSNNRGYAH